MSQGIERLSQIFRRFAELECHGSSPLYERLSLSISENPEMLRLAANARKGQPIPNLFFAAVHWLLLNRQEHELSRFYASLTDSPHDGNPFAAFRDFCFKHKGEIVGLLRTKLVQTNVVERCSNLLPAFGLVAHRAGESPLSLIEVGTSAGLNLFWDKYRYDYGNELTTGDSASTVQLTSTLRGSLVPTIPTKFPVISQRIGLDLNPVGVNDGDAVSWLRALIWPEHKRRVQNFQSAIGIVRQNPPEMIAGDALETLHRVFEDAIKDSTLCIFHSHTLNQFTPKARQEFYTLMETTSLNRDVYVLAMEYVLSTEGVSGAGSSLELSEYKQGERIAKHLANCDAHGRWIEWLDEDSSV